MIPKNYQALIDKLILGTNMKKISWKRTSRPSEYQALIGSGAITVDNWTEDFNGLQYVDLVIWNDEGERIDRLQATEDEEDYASIMEIYECARRAYLKIDETINDIMNHLDF
ncbi:hypothetical protein [Bacteroides sp. BFG-606]|uniref:hypothetical protein n=1 Tax=Bacteroides sp. BFG-606 TaxID=2972763 RepID=UPI00216556EC|nr:hypothetical protein [Bacteroides sp. BFG-606]MCS2337932.1 hypothetical protein [Bacteroides sp. BFG-606]